MLDFLLNFIKSALSSESDANSGGKQCQADALAAHQERYDQRHNAMQTYQQLQTRARGDFAAKQNAARTATAQRDTARRQAAQKQKGGGYER